MLWPVGQYFLKCQLQQLDKHLTRRNTMSANGEHGNSRVWSGILQHREEQKTSFERKKKQSGSGFCRSEFLESEAARPFCASFRPKSRRFVEVVRLMYWIAVGKSNFLCVIRRCLSRVTSAHYRLQVESRRLRAAVMSLLYGSRASSRFLLRHTGGAVIARKPLRRRRIGGGRLGWGFKCWPFPARVTVWWIQAKFFEIRCKINVNDEPLARWKRYTEKPCLLKYICSILVTTQGG